MKTYLKHPYEKPLAKTYYSSLDRLNRFTSRVDFRQRILQPSTREQQRLLSASPSRSSRIQHVHAGRYGIRPIWPSDKSKCEQWQQSRKSSKSHWSSIGFISSKNEQDQCLRSKSDQGKKPILSSVSAVSYVTQENRSMLLFASVSLLLLLLIYFVYRRRSAKLREHKLNEQRRRQSLEDDALKYGSTEYQFSSSRKLPTIIEESSVTPSPLTSCNKLTLLPTSLDTTTSSSSPLSSSLQSVVTENGNSRKPSSTPIPEQSSSSISSVEQKPSLTSVPEQKPSSISSTEQKPLSKTAPEQKPATTSSIQQKPSSTSSVEQKLLSKPVSDQKSGSASSTEQKPSSTSSIEQKPLSKSVLEQKPTSTSPIEQKPESTSSVEQKVLSKPAPDKKPGSASSTEQKSSSTSSTEQKPLSKTVSEQKPASTSSVEQKFLSKPVSDQKPGSASSTEQKTSSIEQKPLSKSAPEQKPASKSSAQQKSSPASSTEQKPTVASLPEQKSSPVSSVEQKSVTKKPSDEIALAKSTTADKEEKPTSLSSNRGRRSRFEQGSTEPATENLAANALIPPPVIVRKTSVVHENVIRDDFKSLEEINDAVKEVGLVHSQLIFGIDYTISNLETGRDSFNGYSLHHIQDGLLNPYQNVITIVGRTLERFDADTLIPVFGFGDRSTLDRKIFPLRPDGSYCKGFRGVLEAYNEVTPKVRMSGPTNFAPLIREAIRIVKKTGEYHILVIVADGQVTNERQTKDAIVEASNYPLSIVMIGVGDGPWDMMEEFDDSLPTRQFDNFQFVNYNSIVEASANTDTAFALHALMEIPSQYAAIKKLGLLGKK